MCVDTSRKASKVKWTERMNSDILECKKKAKEMVSSNNPPYYGNGRKKGYIEVTKDLWEEKGYGCLELESKPERSRLKIGKNDAGLCEEQRELQFSGRKRGRT